MIQAQTIEQAVDRILEREGGFSFRATDQGGATNYGITITTLRQWRFPKPVTVDDVRSLTEGEARAIYRAQYIDGPKFHELDDARLFDLVVDCGVNHGTHTAVSWLQRAAMAQVDGIVGPATLDAVQRTGASTVYKRILRTRIKFYASIVTAHAEQMEFLEGWMARACAFIDPLELPK